MLTTGYLEADAVNDSYFREVKPWYNHVVLELQECVSQKKKKRNKLENEPAQKHMSRISFGKR